MNDAQPTVDTVPDAEPIELTLEKENEIRSLASSPDGMSLHHCMQAIDHLLRACKHYQRQILTERQDRGLDKKTADEAATSSASRIVQLEHVLERVKQGACSWKMEARTQRSIVKEIYAIVGFDGGDYNGAVPVRQFISNLQSHIGELRESKDVRISELLQQSVELQEDIRLLQNIRSAQAALIQKGVRGEMQALKFAESDLAVLRAFAKKCLKDWPDGGIDGFDLQDYAIEFGLLSGKTVNGPCCEEGCNCAETAEFPTTCYFRTPLLTGIEPKTNDPT